jgi:proteasome alpha subunit
MTEEPYRWLEAISNRREYVREQLKGGTPVFAASLPDGILLMGVGTGQSKVFELFDRQALAGLGHPADIEKVRQAAIDAAHVEAFTRAPEDVSLRRLVSFGLGPQLKTSFEQVFNAPFLVELILAELGSESARDVLFRLRFDGSFQMPAGGVVVAGAIAENEAAAQAWLTSALAGVSSRNDAADLIMQAWWCLSENKPSDAAMPGLDERRAGWQQATRNKTIEIGWLDRRSARQARYEPKTAGDLGLRGSA